MDAEIRHHLDRIEKKVDYAVLLLEEKNTALSQRVGRLEKGAWGVMVAFVAAGFAWVFRH